MLWVILCPVPKDHTEGWRIPSNKKWEVNSEFLGIVRGVASDSLEMTKR